MMHQLLKNRVSVIPIFFSIFIFFQLNAVAQPPSQGKIDIHINSGNPVYPFPQFLSYKNNSATYENLASHSGVGVTHAEMEQTVRDAYKILSNRMYKTGSSLNGKDYIYFSSSPNCTEGDGYALLAAVSMADKETFDGLWLWIHDNALNKVKRYSDCGDNSPGYAYSAHLPGWKNIPGDNSAADGDFDIGFALLCAYYQWGENMGIDDKCGQPISYKKEAIEFLKGLTDTASYAASNNSTLICGDIGLDGYFKGGDSWQEMTDWATNTSNTGLSKRPESVGPQTQWFDYAAPSYFHAFADFLSKEDSTKYAWNLKQFRRAEASADWLMGHLLNDNRMIPYIGHVTVTNDTAVTFANANQGEDFRLAWRTILNYLWHGNPTSTWDPKTHQVKLNAPNTFERDVGLRYGKFLWDTRQSPWNNTCIRSKDKLASYWGPSMLLWSYTMFGKADTEGFFLNWVPGVGSPSAVISQDFNLMAELYRGLEIEWDVDSMDKSATTHEGAYLNSTPHYFHEWFRLMGLLTLTGNYPAPSDLKPVANTKVYLDIDKTFAFENDTITYTIDYRNFGSLDAENVTIVDTLHKDFVYISSTGGGTFNSATHMVTWNIGTLKGFKSTTGVDPTMGKVKLVVKIGKATENQYRNRVSISCSNGSGWTSNEYPNEISSVMKRNYLDIAKRALVIKKTATNSQVNPGKEIQFAIDFENTSDAGWINGGRPGVHFGFAHESGAADSSTHNTMGLRLFHDADEAYIDYGNYRVSYFLFNMSYQCYADNDGCKTGWHVTTEIKEGLDSASNVKIFQENITAGQENGKKWNQRIVVQFSDPTDPDRALSLATIDHHLSEYRGMEQRIHRGGISPLRLVWRLNNSDYTGVKWGEDWSWDPDAGDNLAGNGKFWPVTNDWSDPDKGDIPVTTWNPKDCSTASHVINNVLVEEWDGYTWRRVAGNGPLPGRDAANVIIRDTIPAGFSFSKFVGKAPFDVEPTINGNVITWTIPKLQIKQKGSLKYIVTAAGNCPMSNKTIMTRSWISADKESPIDDSVAITVTCDSITPPPPPPTSMYKTSDKPVYQKGDTVTYKIAYKQTHGSIVSNGSNSSEWIDKAGSGLFSINKDTITYDKQNAMMVHKYSYGVNGTFGGTINPAYYSEFSLVARCNGNDYVEIRLKKDWGNMIVQFFNSGTKVGGDQQFAYKNFNSTPPTFDFKIKLYGDTISLWAGDTSTEIPPVTQTGIAIREGYAGVKQGKDVGQTKLWNWNSHFDAAFDLSIHDKLPSVLTYVSSGGSIITGQYAGQQLTAVNSNGNLNWSVVNGDSPLEANDSLQLWVKAILNDCTGDTIFNTAYANIRGYPIDSIGARAKSTCSSGDVGKPDHIDIILDTLSFSRLSDEHNDSITLGTNQKTYPIFAVVRDKYGNFVRYATNASWNSENSQIATISTSGNDKQTGIIGNVAPGTTKIKVAESGLTEDAIYVTISASATWPNIKSAIMMDRDGDIVPDNLQLNLTDELQDDQTVDSVCIDYNSKHYKVSGSDITVSGSKLYVLFNSSTGIDGEPSGKATLYLKVDGNEKQSTKTFVDGVPPALLSASVMENDDGSNNALYLNFSEPVDLTSLSGQQLQLIKKNSTDTILVTINSITAVKSDSQVNVSISASKSPEAGDALRLVPGSSNGKIADRNANLPHDLNRPVILGLLRGPASIRSVCYLDENADGVVDNIKIRFKRSVQESELSKLTVFWNSLPNFPKEDVSVGSIEKINDSTYILPVKGPSGQIKTDHNVEITVVFSQFSDQPISSNVSDSTAPVVTKAEVHIGTMINTIRQQDTLIVTLSEQLKQFTNSEPFLFAMKNANGYQKVEVTKIGFTGTTYRFVLNNQNSISNLSNGDSIWINPAALLSDNNGAIQDNPNNHRAVVKIVWPAVNWRAVAIPNILVPGQTEIPASFKSNLKYGTGIKAQSTSPIDVSQCSAQCIIYDGLGNKVLSEPMMVQDGYFYYIWGGYNKNKRLVGSGTYLGYVVITEDGKKSVAKVKIAVKR